MARFTCPEFTSLCPLTGQPDFAHLMIDYVPGKWIVESKSLKLFLQSFRNYGAFHEDCTIAIAKRIKAAIAPKWLRIGGYWYPRGGMPIDVFWQTGAAPKNLWIPPQDVPPLSRARLRWPAAPAKLKRFYEIAAASRRMAAIMWRWMANRCAPPAARRASGAEPGRWPMHWPRNGTSRRR